MGTAISAEEKAAIATAIGEGFVRRNGELGFLEEEEVKQEGVFIYRIE